MTDQEIIQKAEEYAKKHEIIMNYYQGTPRTDFYEKKKAYIAGAHSRDKEIEQLERFLKISSDTTDEMTEYIIKLREEIEELKKK